MSDLSNENFESLAINLAPYYINIGDIIDVEIVTLNSEATAFFNGNVGSGMQNMGGNNGEVAFYIRGFHVNDSGYIDLPIIGNVKAYGITEENLKIIITEKLSAYLVNSGFLVKAKLTGIRFAVVGEVRRPGRYVIFQNRVSILEALAEAGDIDFIGDRQNVKLIRPTQDSLMTYNIDLTSKEIMRRNEFFIKPGDIINVQPLGQKAVGFGSTWIDSFRDILSITASTLTLVIAINSLAN